MKQRVLLLLLVTLSIATTASAAWHPAFDSPSITVKVGETGTVGAYAWWSGMTSAPPPNWTFKSTAPAVAEVSGWMQGPGRTVATVTGVKPGQAAILVWPRGWQEHVQIFVVCGEEDPVRPAKAEIDTVIGRTVALQAVTPIANRTAFTWYRGRIGDTSQPLRASGPEATLVAEQSGTQYAWVLATTPCSSSSAEFRIDAKTSKQRAVRR